MPYPSSLISLPNFCPASSSLCNRTWHTLHRDSMTPCSCSSAFQASDLSPTPFSLLFLDKTSFIFKASVTSSAVGGSDTSLILLFFCLIPKSNGEDSSSSTTNASTLFPQNTYLTATKLNESWPVVDRREHFNSQVIRLPFSSTFTACVVKGHVTPSTCTALEEILQSISESPPVSRWHFVMSSSSITPCHSKDIHGCSPPAKGVCRASPMKCSGELLLLLFCA